jgi:acyl-CoA thioesterase-1
MRLSFLFVLMIIVAPCHAAPAAASPARGPILVLGDSLSAAHNIPLESGWVALLDKRLRQPDSHYRYDVVNASISGETTDGGLARLPALLAQHHPSVVVIELGSNDGLRGLPLERVRANLKRMVEDARGAGAAVVLVGVEIPINYGPQYRDGLRAIYRDAAADFNVPLVPFLLDGVAQDPALMQDDGLHPRAAAEPKVLANVWPALESALRTVH